MPRATTQSEQAYADRQEDEAEACKLEQVKVS
jgi:hypothetical protein